MNCNRARKLIFTDYIDGNLKGRAQEQVELHLGSCPGCHALAEELKSAGKLIKTVSQEDAPSRVWDNILAKVSAPPAKYSFMEEALTYIQCRLPRLRPAIAMAGAAILLLFVLATVRLMPHKDRLETTIANEEILAISYTSDEDDISEYDFGTPAEMFLL